MAVHTDPMFDPTLLPALDLSSHDRGSHDPSSHDLGGATDAPLQLSLLPSSSAPVRFRLDRHTRELGLAHIARIRRQLAERAANRSEDQYPTRRQHAA